MARIQILELPDSIDELRPFALIIDQAQDLITAADGFEHDPFAALKAATGARAVFVTAAVLNVE